MTRTLAEADGVCGYQPPLRVPPGPGKKKRSMKRSMTWRDPSLLVNRGDKTSKKIQTETQLSAGGFRCNLCGYGRFATEVIMRKHQSSQACTQALRKEEKQRAKKQYRTMFMPGHSKLSSSSSSVAAASLCPHLCPHPQLALFFTFLLLEFLVPRHGERQRQRRRHQH